MMPAEAAETPASVLLWAVLGLLAVVGTLAAYIAKKYERDRRDSKEERALLLQVVKDNTAAMTRLTTVVDGVQNTLNHYIDEER